MFEISQGNHNSLDYHKSFWNDFHQLQSLHAWHKSKIFLHVQNTQTSRVDSFYFFQMSFFSTKCAPFFFLIGENFNIDD